jgi:hypothetical protein
MLYPFTSGKQALLDFRVLQWSLGQYPLGYHGYYGYAPTRWSGKIPGGATVSGYDVLVQTAGLQATLEVFNGYVRDVGNVGAIVDFGVAWRSLGDEIAAGSASAFRTFALGTDRLSFVGRELSFTILVGDARVGSSIYFFPWDVPGFSHGKAVFGGAIATPLFQRTITGAGIPIIMHM